MKKFLLMFLVFGELIFAKHIALYHIWDSNKRAIYLCHSYQDEPNQFEEEQEYIVRAVKDIGRNIHAKWIKNIKDNNFGDTACYEFMKKNQNIWILDTEGASVMDILEKIMIFFPEEKSIKKHDGGYSIRISAGKK